MTHRTLARRTSLRGFVDGADWSEFATAISLHAHTSHSKEVLSDLPAYIRRIPLVADRFEVAMRSRLEETGSEIDFSSGWWHPPVTPQQVFESEASQIETRFGLGSLVSVTDHDDITAGVELQQLYAARRSPVSFEWTVPYGRGFF